MSKSFALAAGEANGTVEEKMPFTMEDDDTQLYAYPPSEGQLVLLLGMANLDETDKQAAALAGAEVMGVFWELMDDGTATHLRKRMRSRQDAFGLQDIMNIVEWLAEEASARPTTLSSTSTSSPGTNGQRSTARARQRASTRSPSPRRGSATSSTRGRSSG